MDFFLLVFVLLGLRLALRKLTLLQKNGRGWRDTLKHTRQSALKCVKVHFASAKLNTLHTEALFKVCVYVCVFKQGREKSTLPSLGEIM